MGGGIVGDIFSLEGVHYEIINEGVQLKSGEDWCRGILYKREGDDKNETVSCMSAVDFFENTFKVYPRGKEVAQATERYV